MLVPAASEMPGGADDDPGGVGKEGRRAAGGGPDTILPATAKMTTSTAGQKAKQRVQREYRDLWGVLVYIGARGGLLG